MTIDKDPTAIANSVALSTATDMGGLRQAQDQTGLMGDSIAAMVSRLAPHLLQSSDIPGHGEAGSYAHNQHQLNCRLCEEAGTLHQITGEQRYADFAADLLSRYADCYLGLGFQQARNTNPAGRIFHQILNENMWLLSMSIGYGCIKHSLTPERRSHIETQLLRPVVEMMTQHYAHHFGTIHNHGLWSVAAVGICGLVIGDDNYVAQAVDGLQGDRTSGGYLAEIGQLFAPSGYYIEGPYYHRFAIRPLLIFAEALHTHRPELDIYNVSGQRIGATIKALLSLVYPDGRLPALNDASLSMGIQDDGLLIAASVYNARYGDDPAVHALARQQAQVWVHPTGLALAASADQLVGNAPPFWPSAQLSEGPNGDKGAQGFLRARAADGDISQVSMNYGQHGMDHGHFDTLGINLFNRGGESLREYGFARWLNVEPKFGGRYLPENKSWARQTLAHNGVVVDRRSQNDGDQIRADGVHGQSHFFVGSGPVQAMSAFANEHYPGVGMQRTVLMIEHEVLSTPLLVDLYRLSSDVEHDYDYALQYSGQICDTSADYQPNLDQWSVLGEAHGYQHLMGMAQASITEPTRLTWLQGQRFNTWLSAADQGELVFAQLGGNDPSFNLRRESTLLLRQRGSTHLFASAFETHGFFDEPTERCWGGRGELDEIRIIGHDDTASVIELRGKRLHLIVMISNRPDVKSDSVNEVHFNGRDYRWTGFFACQE
ncbi:heparinase II/III domain-containing protein [Granulosicoccus antarcticus]|uniref:Alginate lyase n=1 Tax=Granulosicoccus antarcticus IMCC3135 TaxID=1192854 RepID=A0A2Z2NX85_9GAMM|nr:heparinase II/III family protein [Granulosicoccus antarcticus]ASJ76056.1 Alginate lyase [Granulosicoccus antarcticus IMCC3135]